MTKKKKKIIKRVIIATAPYFYLWLPEMQPCFTKALIIALLTQSGFISCCLHFSEWSTQESLSRYLFLIVVWDLFSCIYLDIYTGLAYVNISWRRRSIATEQGDIPIILLLKPMLYSRKKAAGFPMENTSAFHNMWIQCTKLLTHRMNSLSIRMIICWTTVSSLQHPAFRHAIPPQSCQQHLDADKQDSDWCHTPSQWQWTLRL